MTDDQIEKLVNGFSDAVNNKGILARLDERTGNTASAIKEIKSWLVSHEKEDDRRFTKSFSMLYIGYGVFLASNLAIIVFFKFNG